MDEVYLASGKLDRDVAVKVLQRTLARDTENACVGAAAM